ncbi:hypothetical protein JY97_07775 [Alkalispirochaeta odontotermitis]|nr:hypothetical protein JY97_07775 [Alkalispirochaeta odontotermitis]
MQFLFGNLGKPVIERGTSNSELFKNQNKYFRKIPVNNNSRLKCLRRRPGDSFGYSSESHVPVYEQFKGMHLFF